MAGVGEAVVASERDDEVVFGEGLFEFVHSNNVCCWEEFFKDFS